MEQLLPSSLRKNAWQSAVKVLVQAPADINQKLGWTELFGISDQIWEL